jgi:hypothetical protein
MVATTPGSIWVIDIETVSNVTITSVTGGGGTWIHCSNCHAFDPATGHSVDAIYNLTGTGGTIGDNLTVNLSGLSGGNGPAINFTEFLPPAGATASLDASGSVFRSGCFNPSGNSTCTGVNLGTLSATDIIVTNPGASAPANWNAALPYTVTMNGGMFNLNTTDGSAPSITIGQRGQAPLFLSLAFKSTAGVFTPPAYLTQNSLVQFKQIQQTCNPTCTFTLPQATGAGHLLFVMSGALAFNSITNVTGGGTWTVPSGANTCRIQYTNTGTPSSSNELACAYALVSTAGATSITVTMSAGVNTGFAIWEIASSTGNPFTLDVQGSTVNGNNAYPHGQALTLGGANDVIFQAVFAPGGASSSSGLPYTYILHSGYGYFQFNNASEGMVLNSGPVATTPIWVDPQATENTAVFGIAFTSPGVSTAPNPPTGLTAIVH